MKVIVVASGEPADGDEALLDGADLVIAVDGGARWLTDRGHRPDLLIGDLDSIPDGMEEELRNAGVEVERHPLAKDRSDAELAVARAADAGADQVIVLGGLGGDRLDHELANLLLLAEPRRHRVADLRLARGSTLVRVVRGGEELRLEAPLGSLVTLLPLGGDALGVRTVGLRFRLDGEALRAGRTRGLSNEVDAAGASVSLERGTLLVVEISKEGASQ